MFEPLGANSGSSSYNSFSWIFNRMTASTGGTGSSDVDDFDDFDDFCQAQLVYALLFAQGVVNSVESQLALSLTKGSINFYKSM